MSRMKGSDVPKYTNLCFSYFLIFLSSTALLSMTMLCHLVGNSFTELRHPLIYFDISCSFNFKVIFDK